MESRNLCEKNMNKENSLSEIFDQIYFLYSSDFTEAYIAKKNIMEDLTQLVFQWTSLQGI
jgi:hypothetical protein